MHQIQEGRRNTMGDMYLDAFSDIVGHEPEVEVLSTFIREDTLGHGWLFSGPLGIGKRTVALAAAKGLVCPNGGCNACSACRRVALNMHPDVFLVQPEGEKHLVEDIRIMQEEAGKTREEASHKVFVIDQAERLTGASANAMLKLLEEPPPRVVFFLIAPSDTSVLPTIRSRLRLLSFRSSSVESVVSALVEQTGLSEPKVREALSVCHGRFGQARELLSDPNMQSRRDIIVRTLFDVIDGNAADGVMASETIVGMNQGILDSVGKKQETDLKNAEAMFGRGRLSSAMRKRMEATHKRQLSRMKSMLIRAAVMDMSVVMRDILAAHVGADVSMLMDQSQSRQSMLVARLASGVALRNGLMATLEADRALARGASPQLCLDAMFLQIAGIGHDSR